MSRPLAAPVERCVDAAHAGKIHSRIERRFPASELNRLRDAGAGEASTLQMTVQFATLEGKVTIDGDLSGCVELTCQRCLQPVAVPVDEAFRVVIVNDDGATPEEYGGYEPIAVDASQLDLGWLAEEQVLLALPLVPKHQAGECNAISIVDAESAPAAAPSPRQQPFGNLRDLLRKP